jgi:hypothetical protein
MGVSRTYAEKATLKLRATGVCAMGKTEDRKGWAFFWLATGFAAVIALIATPDMPQWSVLSLLFMAACSYATAFYFFGWFKVKRKILAICATVIVLSALLFAAWAEVRRFLPRAQLHISEIRFKPIDANRARPFDVIFANAGTIAAQDWRRTYSVGVEGRILTPAEEDRVYATTLTTLREERSTSDIQPQEPNALSYFTAYEHGVSSQEEQDLIDGKAYLYIILIWQYRDKHGPHETAYCAFFNRAMNVKHTCSHHNHED